MNGYTTVSLERCPAGTRRPLLVTSLTMVMRGSAIVDQHFLSYSWELMASLKFKTKQANDNKDVTARIEENEKRKDDKQKPEETESTEVESEKEEEKNERLRKEAFGRKPKIARSPKPKKKKETVNTEENMIAAEGKKLIADVDESTASEVEEPSTDVENTASNAFDHETPERMSFRRERLSSLPDLSKSTPVLKRKRTETPDKEHDTGVDSFIFHLRHIFEEITYFEHMMLNTYKPKTELVELAGRMVMHMNYLDLKNVEEILEDIREDRKIIETHKQNQCDECKDQWARNRRRRILKKEETFDNFSAITENDWIAEVFPKAIEQIKPIWEAPLEQGIILPCSRNYESSNKMIGTAINKFGGRVGLIEQKKEKGEVAYMTHTLGFPDSGGNMVYATRRIYYPVIEDGTAWEKVDDRILFQAVQKLKEDILRNEVTSIAIPEINNVNGLVFKRIVEYMFADTGVQILMYRLADGNTKQQKNQTGVAPTTIAPRPNETTAIRRMAKKSKKEAVIVQMEGRSYSDMLKLVKETIDPRQVGVDIKDVSETKSGKLLLKIDNGLSKAEALRDELRVKIPEATTSVLTNSKTLHIKGMDSVITETEIRKAICDAISIKAEEMKLSALRPAFGSKQNITVITSVANAEKLISLGSIRIGWTNCKILERKTEDRCFRCWEQGHVKSQCKGPNRENLCMRCSQQGHKAKSCKNQPHCLACDMGGHQTGSRACQNYRKRNVKDNPN